MHSSSRMKRCRLCLDNCTQYIEIFKDDFPKMIYLLTKIKVSHNDDFPKVSCMPCALEVKNAVYARKKIILSHKKLLAEAQAKFINTDDFISEEPDYNSDNSASIEPSDSHAIFDPLNTEISLKLLPKNASIVIVEEDENEASVQPITEVLLPEIPVDNSAKSSTTTLEIGGDLKQDNPEIIDITEISNLLNYSSKPESEMDQDETTEDSKAENVKIKFINKNQLMKEISKSGKPCKYCGKTIHRSSLKRHELRHEQGTASKTPGPTKTVRVTLRPRPKPADPKSNFRRCPACKKMYHKGSLTRHITNAHNGNTEPIDDKADEVANSPPPKRSKSDSEQTLDDAVNALLLDGEIPKRRFSTREGKNGHKFDEYLSKYNAHKSLQETLKVDIDQATGIEAFFKSHNAPKSNENDNDSKFLDYVDKDTNEVHKALPISASDYPGDPKTMSCKICKITFNHRNQYQNHISKHKVKICHICNKEVRTCYMKRHMMAHDTEPTPCEECGITYKNQLSFHMHNVLYHENRYSCVCEDCGLSFKTKSKLMLHKRKVHIKEKNMKCETCGKLFFSKVHLKNHIKMKHLKIRSHMCQFCGKGYSSKFALTTHLRQHTNEAPHKCSFCGESFRQKVSLRNHLKNKHKIKEEENFFCEQCGKGFATLGALEVHSRVHEGIKCPHCADTFAEPAYLEQHVAATHIAEQVEKQEIEECFGSENDDY